MARFKTWLEGVNLFGFEKSQPRSIDGFESREPLKPFDISLMIEMLSSKRIGVNEAEVPFQSEIVWGGDLGSIKIEADTGLTLFVKRLCVDLSGQPVWIAEESFQVNRNGFGGTEAAAAQQLLETAQKVFQSPIGSADDSFRGLDRLVSSLYEQLRASAKSMFLPVGAKMVDSDTYVMCFEMRGGGVEAQGHRRVEQNQTTVRYDREAGVIRVENYNIESPIAGTRSWQVMPSDLSLTFLPSQGVKTIARCLATHLRYY